MWGFIKNVVGIQTRPRPEVELRKVLSGMDGKGEAELGTLHMEVCRLLQDFDIDDRVFKALFYSGRERSRQKANNLEHLENIFQMEQTYLAQGMATEALATKLVALYFACEVVDSTFDQRFEQNEVIMLFNHFRETGFVDMNPPRRVHISPMD